MDKVLSWLKPLASRKFLLSLGVIALATGLLWYGRLDGVTWAGLVGAITGLYAGANALVHRGYAQGGSGEGVYPSSVKYPANATSTTEVV